MKNMVPLCKQSKKSRKAYYSSQRRSWNEVNPVTRIIPSGKLYRRETEKKRIQQAFGGSDR